MIQVEGITAFNDNYIWLLHNEDRQCYVVDPGDPDVVEQYLEEHDFILQGILITHHHWDHTNGVEQLAQDHDIPVYGPDNPAIKGITVPLVEGDTVTLLNQSFTVITTPGHTLDHITYFSAPDDGVPLLFCGDTLFSAGCGRLFEGTAAQMLTSINKLRILPGTTEVYCTHEYTLSNLNFALAVEPENKDIQNHQHQVVQLRDTQQPSLPSTIGLELKINPFMRTDQQSVVSAALEHSRLASLNDAEVFGTLRLWKDSFQ
jgi:hydroxyacylglutathione hydrolase